jgi:hypothetical protein
MLKTFTHADLVARAGRWLVNTYGCQTAFTEFESYTGEKPDAIGWKPNGRSVLVECKVSRSDFLVDRKKPFRMNPNIGVGAERYYMTTVGLVLPEELPEGWGLLEAKGNAVKVVSACRPRKDMRSDMARKYEMMMLLAALRRTQVRIDPVRLQDWLRFENRMHTDSAMQNWVSAGDHRAFQLEQMGFVPVVDPQDLPISDVTGEIWCLKHDCEFSDCPCLPPNDSQVIYEEVEGVLFGLRSILPLTLVPHDSGSTLSQ